jgi:hypothetical protein
VIHKIAVASDELNHFAHCTSITVFKYMLKFCVIVIYSNVRGGGNCEAISDGAGVSL